MNIIKRTLYTLQISKLFKEKISLDYQNAIAGLNDFLPGRTTPPAFKQETEVMPIVDLMLVVPVYNVALYLDDCVQSILNQKTKYTYMVIIVDDGSSDESTRILEKYENNERIKVIYHQKNMGVSVARNTGMKTIFGRYIMFVDSDDLLEENAIEKLMDAAFKYNADIVEGSHLRFKLEKEGEIISHCSILKEIQALDLFGYAWGKVIRAEIMEKTCFPIGYAYEDTIMAALVHPECNKVYAIPDIVYYYRLNPTGIDTITSKKRDVLDTFWMSKYCLEEFVKRGLQITKEYEQQFFNQIRLNYIRLNGLSEEIMKDIFCVYCVLYKKYFVRCKNKKELLKYKWLRKSLENNSFSAYCYIMKYWDVLDVL